MEPLEIEFENGVLRFGATFAGRAFNSEVETTLGQNALAGNAADMAVLGFDDGNVQPLGTPLAENLSVSVPISKNLLANINIQPSVFTPNGDGINDQSIVQYDITNIVRLSPVEVLIYDLSGRLVRRLVDGKAISGRFRQAWNGRDEAGNIVPPGHYVVSIQLRAGTGPVREVKMVRVTY